MPFLKLLDLLSDKRFPWLFWKQIFLESQINEGERRRDREIRVAITFDVEQDGGSGGKKSSEKAKTFLDTIKKVLNKKPATFFIQGDLVKELSQRLRQLKDKHELGLHGFSHQRLWNSPVWFIKDRSLNKKEKEESLKKALDGFSQSGLPRPRSFRAPNMVIDKESLKALREFDFSVDSSFSSFRSYSPSYFDSGLWEIPISSLKVPRLRLQTIIPTLDFQVLNMENLRRLPNNIWQKNIRQMVNSSKNGYLVFLGHSWDFDKQVFQDLIDFLEKNWQIRYLTMQKLAEELSKEDL